MGKWLGRFHSWIKVSMALCNGRMRTGSCCCHCRSLLIEVGLAPGRRGQREAALLARLAELAANRMQSSRQ